MRSAKPPWRKWHPWKFIGLSERLRKDLIGVVYDYTRDTLSDKERLDLQDAVWHELCRDRREGRQRGIEKGSRHRTVEERKAK